MRYLSLTVAFLLELAVLVAVGYYAFTLRTSTAVHLIVGIGGPVVMAVLWGVFASPNASVPLHGVVNAAFQLAWFGVGVLALLLANRSPFAISLAAVYGLNSLILLATKAS